MNRFILSIFLVQVCSLVNSIPFGTVWFSNLNWYVPSEECSLSNNAAMRRCLARDAVARQLTYECIDSSELNLQNYCSYGERLVVKTTKDCITLKCIKNQSPSGKLCADGEVPYGNTCHKLGDRRACKHLSDSVHLTAKLKADIFGNIACKCSQDEGYLNYNNKCHGELTFSSCGFSTQYQLVRLL